MCSSDLGALDAQVRQDLRRWLRNLHDEMHITSVFVTHDQDEALSMSDAIAVMHKGAIEQLGTPREIYSQPATRLVASFVGEMNWIGDFNTKMVKMCEQINVEISKRHATFRKIFDPTVPFKRYPIRG